MRSSNSTNQGISTLQGPHQVAQKLRSTALPLYSDKVTTLPSESFSLNSGAFLRSFVGRTLAASALDSVEQEKNPIESRNMVAVDASLMAMLLRLVYTGNLLLS